MSAPHESSHLRRDAGLVASMLAGPLAWAVDLQASYSSVHPLCARHERWPLFLIAALTLATCAVAFVVAGRWESVPPEAPDNEAQRLRFMVLGARALCAFFALVILATTLPAFILTPCEVP